MVTNSTKQQTFDGVVNMPGKVSKIWCANKDCGRGPSYMGLEPMYAIPVNDRYHFFCGNCFKEILNAFGVNIQKDLMNLLTPVSGTSEYHNFVSNYIKKTRR